MKKLFGGIGFILVIVVVIFYFFGPDLGFGKGNGGNGEGSGDTPSASPNAQVDEQQHTTPDNEGNIVKISILVQQGKYFIDDKEVTLDRIKELIQAEENDEVQIEIEDNYGSAKAWDDIQKLMNDLGVSYTEKNH